MNQLHFSPILDQFPVPKASAFIIDLYIIRGCKQESVLGKIQ